MLLLGLLRKESLISNGFPQDLYGFCGLVLVDTNNCRFN